MCPKIAVIIPYYEGDSRIMATVESVRAQDMTDWEMIVVDDGSVSRARAALAGLRDDRIKIIEQPHAGKGAAVNRGARETSSEILCVFDHDDIMLPRRFRVQCEAFEQNPDAAVVYSDYERIRADGEMLDSISAAQVAADEALELLSKGRSIISIQTMSMRRKIFDESGGFSEDPALTGFDDAEFLIRILSSGKKISYVPGVVARWIEHEKNFSKSGGFQKSRESFMAHLGRLRAAGRLKKNIYTNFMSHNLAMSGIYFLERREHLRAAARYAELFAVNPGSPTGWLMLAKSAALYILSLPSAVCRAARRIGARR